MTDFAMLPPELQAQAMQLQRRRAMSDALMQRSLQPMQAPTNPGRIASRQSPLAAIAQVAGAALAGKQANRLGEEERAFGTQYNTQMKDAIKAYFNRRDGVAAVPGNAFTTDGTPGVPGDPRGAAVEALTSGFGPLQDLGKMDLTEAAKNTMTSKDWLGLADKFSPESVIAAQLAGRQGHPNPSTFLKPKAHIMQVDGSVVEATEGQPPKKTGYFGDEFEKNDDGTPKITYQKGADGKLEPYQRDKKTGKLYKLDNAPNISVSASAGGKFEGKMGEGQAELVRDELKNSRGIAREAANDLKILAQAVDSYNRGISTGSFQGVRNEIAKVAETAGFKSPDPKVSNTDFFMKMMAGRILEHTKELRPLSDTDRKYLEDIKAGKNMTDDALRRLLEIGIEQGTGAIDAHNENVQKAAGLPGAIPGFAGFYTVGKPDKMPKLIDPKATGAARPGGADPQGMEDTPVKLPDGKIRYKNYTWPNQESLDSYLRATKGNP